MAGNNMVPAKAGMYGGLKPSGSIGAKEFAEHDASKVWDDQGAAQNLAQDVAETLVPLMQSYGAEQVKYGVLDYFRNAFGDACVVQGELCFMVDASNNEAEFAVFWKLGDTIAKAIAEAENAADTEMLNAIGRFLAQLNATFRPPVAAGDHGRAGPRPVQSRGTRPAGVAPRRQQPAREPARAGGARRGAEADAG